ncbi:hypothetical protein JCM10207_001513 [Rhodosporidiobolus poonsookiae]
MNNATTKALSVPDKPLVPTPSLPYLPPELKGKIVDFVISDEPFEMKDKHTTRALMQVSRLCYELTITLYDKTPASLALLPDILSETTRGFVRQVCVWKRALTPDIYEHAFLYFKIHHKLVQSLPNLNSVEECLAFPRPDDAPSFKELEFPSYLYSRLTSYTFRVFTPAGRFGMMDDIPDLPRLHLLEPTRLTYLSCTADVDVRDNHHFGVTAFTAFTRLTHLTHLKLENYVLFGVNGLLTNAHFTAPLRTLELILSLYDLELDTEALRTFAHQFKDTLEHLAIVGTCQDVPAGPFLLPRLKTLILRTAAPHLLASYFGDSPLERLTLATDYFLKRGISALPGMLPKPIIREYPCDVKSLQKLVDACETTLKEVAIDWELSDGIEPATTTVYLGAVACAVLAISFFRGKKVDGQLELQKEAE